MKYTYHNLDQQDQEWLNTELSRPVRTLAKSLFILVLLFPVALVAEFLPGTIVQMLFFNDFAAAILCVIMAWSYNNPDKIFVEWFDIVKERHMKYYGDDPNKEWKLCNMVAVRAVNAVAFNNDWKESSPWLASRISYDSSLFDVDKLIKDEGNGYYDYTDYFVRLAYFFMVACHREQIEQPKVCNWAECIAYTFFGFGKKTGMLDLSCLAPSEQEMKSRLANDPNKNKPFGDKMIAPWQRREFNEFDYRKVDDDESGWIWDVWHAALKMFQEQKDFYDTMQLGNLKYDKTSFYLWDKLPVKTNDYLSEHSNRLAARAAFEQYRQNNVFISGYKGDL